MQALITGSLAYDYLMRVSGRFWPMSPDKEFSAAYIAPTLQKHWGGCAGNIAYALQALGDIPVIMATAGEDFASYHDYLRGLQIDTSHILVLADFYTAQAYVTTDEDGNQFIVFHPGATAEAHRQKVSEAISCPLAIVSPNGKEGMMQHCRDLAAQKTPFIFDPGQVIGMYSADELLDCLQQCTYAILNVGEWTILQEKTQLSKQAVADKVDALIITAGANGSEVMVNGKLITVPSVSCGETQDTTGCGDAFRAGVIHGLLRNWHWLRILRFASVVAGVLAAHSSPQGYQLSAERVADICQREFGEA